MKSQLIKEIEDWVKENGKIKEVWNDKEKDYENDVLIISKDLKYKLEKLTEE